MFIYTIADVIGVFFWGFVLLVFALFFACVGIDKLLRKFRRTKPRV